MATPSSRVLVPVVGLALLLVLAWLLGPALWGPAPPAEPPAAADAGAGPVAAEPAVAARPGDPDARGEGAPPAARERVGARTLVTGSFRAPVGAWPGGGRAELHPVFDPPEGGVMGLVGAGVQQARRAADPKGDPPATRRSIEQMLGRTEPVTAVDLDGLGAFVFEDPPAGLHAVRLRHPHLQNAAPAEVQIEAGGTRDLGVLATRLAASLLVMVTDPSGRPVPRASVQLGRQVDLSRFMDPSALGDLLDVMRMFVPRDARTDERGVCHFEGIEGEVSWNLHVASEGFVEHHGVVPVALGRDNVARVALSKGASVRVQVTGAGGLPHPGARLLLRFPGIEKPTPLGTGYGEVVSYRLKTGDDGSVERSGLPIGPAELEVRTPGYLRETRELTTAADRTASAAFRLDPGVSVAGRVLGEDGQPLPDAHVMHMALLGQSFMGTDLSKMVGLDMLSLGIEDRGVPCDEQGRFVLGGFERDEVANLVAAAPGFDPGRADDVAAGSVGVEIRLLRSGHLAGRVLSEPDGAPVTEFEIALEQRAFLVFDRTVVSETFAGRADGSFRLEAVARDTFELVVKAEGRAPWTRTVDLSGGSVDVGEIRLELPGAIEGITVDPLGNPLAGVEVRVARGGMADMMAMARFLGSVSVTSGDDGRFRIDGLPGRAVRLLADKEGYAPLRSRVIRVEPGEVTSGQVLQLTSGGSIRGQLVDGDGRSLAGWRIQAAHAAGRSLQFTTTDADGGFVLVGLPAGTHKVDALPADYMQRFAARPRDIEDGAFDLTKLIGDALQQTASDRVVVREGEEAELTLVFESPDHADGRLVAVEGGVRVGGRPMPSGMVLLLPAGSAVPRHVATVAGGEFRVSGVLPGAYTVRVQADILTGFIGTPRRVRIPESETHRLDLDLPGGRLEGVVVHHHDGAPASGVVLGLHDPGASAFWTERFDIGEGLVLTDATGRFRFDGLAEGTYEIIAREMALAGGATRSGRLSHLALGPGEVREGLVLHVGSGGSIQVTVRDGMGPRSNALVTLLGPSGAPLDLFHRMLTDSEGSVVFQGVPPGSYRVSADAPAAAPEVSDAVHVTPGEERALDVFLRHGAAVQLEIVGEVPAAARGQLLHYSVWQGGALARVGRVVVPADPDRAGARTLELGSLAPGVYTLRAESPAAGLVELERRVPEDGAAVWRIDLAAAVR